MKKVLFPWLLSMVCVAFATPGFGQSTDPIKVGMIFATSGRVANYGTLAQQGAQLAVEQLNEAGGINGRKLEPIYGDSAGDPDAGVAEFRRLVREGVDVVVGPSLGTGAVALSKLAQELAVPLIVPVPLTPEITGSACNRFTFRVSQSLDQNIKSAAIVASRTKARSWTVIGPDNQYGKQAWEMFQKYLRGSGSSASFRPAEKIVLRPPGTVNWGAEIAAVIADKPEGVLVTLRGSDLVEFCRQAAPKNFFKQDYVVMMNLGASTEVLSALQYVLPDGVLLGAPFWFQADTGMVGHMFTAAYRTRYKFAPSWPSAGAYSAVTAYAAAVRKAGTTNKNEVVKALEGLAVELPVGNVTIRAEDHQALVPGFWGLSGTDVAYRVKVITDIQTIPAEEITPPWQETGCKLGR